MSKHKIPEVGQKVRLLLFNGEPCNEVVEVKAILNVGFYFEPYVFGSCYFSLKSDLDQYELIESETLSILDLLQQEVDRVEAGPHGRDYASAHEFYGVLKEEVDEVWDEIKKKNPNQEELNQEVIQVMSVCFRYLKQQQ